MQINNPILENNNTTHKFIGRTDFLLGKSIKSISPIGFRKTQKSECDGELISYRGDAHILTCAKTGAGKGRDVVIPNLLTNRSSCVVLDVKGELTVTTERSRKQMGHRIIKIDPWHRVTKCPDRFNPFDIFQLADNLDLDIESQYLAEVFSQKVFSKEPFWDLQGTGLLSGVISVIASNYSSDKRNFNTLMNLFMNEDAVYSLACEMDRRGAEFSSMAKHEIGAFLNLSDVTRSGVLATTNGYLKILHSKKVVNCLGDSTFSLIDLIKDKEPTTIYFIIPPSYIKSHFALIKIWIHILLRALTTRREIPELPMMFFLDEIAQFGEFPALENIMTIGRGYGIKVHCVLQNLQQLKKNYPQSWETIIGNCGVHQFFGIEDHLSAKELEFISGIPATEFIKLKKDEQYLILEGRKEKAGRINYLKDTIFKGLFDANPFYANKINANKSR